MYSIIETCRLSSKKATLPWKEAKPSLSYFTDAWSLLTRSFCKSFPKCQVSSETNKTLLSAETFQKLKLLKLPSQAEVLVWYDKTAPLTVQSIRLKDYWRFLQRSWTYWFRFSSVLDLSTVPARHTSRRSPKEWMKAKLTDLERNPKV